MQVRAARPAPGGHRQRGCACTAGPGDLPLNPRVDPTIYYKSARMQGHPEEVYACEFVQPGRCQI